VRKEVEYYVRANWVEWSDFAKASTDKKIAWVSPYRLRGLRHPEPE